MEHLRTPDEPASAVVYHQILLTLPVLLDIEASFWGALVEICFNTAWVEYGTMDTRDAANYIKEILRSRKEFNMLGTIQAVVRDSLDSSMLLCDGSVYNKEDFPQLWDVWPSAMKDATTLTLPDLQNLFLVGAGLDYSLADTGGTAEETLTIDEMPEHSHGALPHGHGYSSASPTIGAAITGVPVPSAVPVPAVTAAADVIIETEGGGEAHNNLPPYFAVVYAVIAKVTP